MPRQQSQITEIQPKSFTFSERNLLSGIGDGEGGVGHGEVGWVGVWGEGGVRIWANEVWAGDFGSFRVIGGEKGRLADRVF